MSASSSPGWTALLAAAGYDAAGLEATAAGGHPILCAACHGSNALPGTGHAGTLGECTVCHASSPQTVSGGPHGMHPVGQAWVGDHEDAAGSACRACHGADSRGSVLSRSLGDRVLSTRYGTKHFWKGFEIACYTCHLGPDDSDTNPNRAPQVADATTTAEPDLEVVVPLTATDADGNPLTLRVVSQPAHGAAWIVAGAAHYRSEPGFSGTETFTFAARDGQTDSNLGTVTVEVGLAGLIFADGFESGTVAAWGL